MIRLQKTVAWCSAITYDQGHVINQYHGTLKLHTGTEDQTQQTLAYERLKWWIQNVLDHSVLINHDDPMLQTYGQTRQRVLAMPDDPVDHLLCMVLYLKFNAIMEGRLTLAELELSSEQGDHMAYVHSNDHDGAIADDHGWWIDPAPVWYDDNHVPAQGKVVELNRKFSWEDLDLGWNQTATDQAATVLFPDFQRR